MKRDVLRKFHVLGTSVKCVSLSSSCGQLQLIDSISFNVSNVCEISLALKMLLLGWSH